MELFWTPEAIRDRDDIYEYIEADNLAAALALDELFAEKGEPSWSIIPAWASLAVLSAPVSW